jgi:MFS family permease
MSEKVAFPKYRWVILALFMFISVVIQIQWLTHAAVARPAEIFYSGQFNPDGFFNIDFLAISYMLVFIIMSFPASYIINKYGIKKGLVFGAVLTGVFSMTKAIFADDFNWIVISQIGLAVAQPFILNAVTAVTVRWFPLKDRAMAAGFSSLAQYLGIVIAMIVTPMMIGSDPSLDGYGSGFEKMLWIYGVSSLLASILLIVFMKENPGGADSKELERYSFFKGLKHILSNRDMILLTLMFLIGLGIFNAVSSMTDSIAELAGVQDSDGLIGGLMLIGGIIGAVVIPTLSDKFRKRKLFLIICLGGMIPGVAGLAFPHLISDVPETIYAINLSASFILGFFVMSAGPIGFQYAAEVSHPAPETLSMGILLWIGQISGMAFVALMSMKSNQYIGEVMAVFAGLAVVAFIMSLVLRESPMVKKV